MYPVQVEGIIGRPKGQDVQIAHAPYNFVPLPDKVALVSDALPSHDRYVGLSGKIECELVTKSPLYTRGLMTRADFDEVGDKRWDELKKDQQSRRARLYTSPNGKLALPGSSLRGMIRELVEIISYSKIGAVDQTTRFFYRAVAAKQQDALGTIYKKQMRQVQAGYLCFDSNNDRWSIHPAKIDTDLSFIRANEKNLSVRLQSQIPKLRSPIYKPIFQEVSFIYSKHVDGFEADEVDEKGRLYLNGWIACSGNMLETNRTGRANTKRGNHWVVGAKDTNAKLIPIAKQAVEDYVNSLTEFQKQAPFDSKKGCLKNGNPVFYLPPDASEKNQVYQFGHSPNFRLPMRRDGVIHASVPLDYVPAELRNPTHNEMPGTLPTIDLTEAIFGYIDKKASSEMQDSAKGHAAYASRVSFSDAELTSDPKTALMKADQILQPAILASPKMPFQHYLVQKNADEPSGLLHYASKTPNETVIRGHKRYWHRGNPTWDDLKYAPKSNERNEKQSKDTQLTGIQPVKAGATFKFTIHFDNLHPHELGALCWALALPADACHKLGMAKPLGMGSVSITPTLKLIQRSPNSAGSSRYQGLFGDKQAAWHEATQTVTDLRLYTEAFEIWLLGQLDPAERNGATHLTEVQRISDLLLMLSFPGPDRNQTRYMQIEPTNEFNDRPVLPTPAAVMGQKRQPRQGSLKRVAVARVSANAAHLPVAAPAVQWHKGKITEIRPDKRRGRVRDDMTQKEYSFGTEVLEGPTPGNKAAVQFQLDGDKVVKVKR